MRIVLVNPYSPALSWFFYAQGMATPPYGMVRLATRLQRQGHQVTVIDGQATYEPQEQTLERVLRSDPELIGIGTTPLLHLYTFMSTSNLPYQLHFAELLRGRGYQGTTLVGGTFASQHPREVLRACTAVDGVLCGDGLQAMTQLAIRLRNGVLPTRLPGLVTRHSFLPQGASAAPDPSLPQLELLGGWPENYGVDEELFLGKTPRRIHPTLPVLTSLGCPHRCTFCATPLFFGGKHTNLRLTEVFEWIDEQIGPDGIRELSFWDDTLTVSASRVRLLCDWLEAHDSQAHWWAFGRSEWLLQHRDLLPVMARAGLKMMWLGVESCRPEHLADYGRSTHLEKARQACQLLLDHGILPTTSFIIGHPDTTRAGLEQEIALSRELFELGAVNVYTLMIPVPGSTIHRRLTAEDRILTHDLRLYAGTRAVIRYRDMESQEVEEVFYQAYKDSILSERHLAHVGRTGMWRQLDRTPADRARILEAGFEEELEVAQSLGAEPLSPALRQLGAAMARTTDGASR